jgi:hypothetical protein
VCNDAFKADVVLTASFALLLLLGVLAPIDGLFVHLWKYRLHARPESRAEHGLHTLRALLFPGLLATLYAVDSRGMLLWIGVALAAADVVVQAADMAIERDSRASAGGLAGFEAALHGLMITIGSASLALLLASKPAAAWSLAAPALVGPGPGDFAESVVALLLPGSIGVAVMHVALWRWPGVLPGSKARKEVPAC